jgi:hypothetical protein
VEECLHLRGDKRNECLIFLFGVISWSLWLNKNDFIFNNKIVSSPRALIFKIDSFLQHWVVAWTGAWKEVVEQLGETLTKKMDDERSLTGVG